MIVKTEEEKKTYRKAAEISTEILKLLSQELHIGVLPADIEKYCWELCKKYEVEPAFYGVVQSEANPFPSSCNINVNNEILHAIPSKTRKLESGDVIKIDFGIKYKGLNTDHCYTFILDKASEEDELLVMNAKLATETAVKNAIVGNTTGDLGNIMWSVADLGGFEILKNYVGHGIGKTLWEEPQIPAYGRPGKGVKLVEGMVICIESQLIKGTEDTFIDVDGWTIKSSNGNKGAMFEYMLIVGKDKPEILTPMQNWEVLVR